MAKTRERWLVTGGAGFIGSHIAQTLVRQGHFVRILDDFSTGKREHLRGFENEVEILEGDLRDPEAVRRATEGIEYISHQGALRSVPKSMDNPRDTHEINITGTLYLLLAAKQAHVRRLVYASSSSVYGDGRRFPQRESQKPSPISPYAASKLAAEHYCVLFSKTFGLETVSLRYFNVYGPRQDPESLYSAVIPRFMEQAQRGEALEVHWDGKQSRDFTFVEDVVRANLLAAKAPKASGGVFNIANGDSHSLLELIRILEKILGRKPPRRHTPKRAGDVRKTWADISQARKLLGYRPRFHFEEGLRKTWNYFQHPSQSSGYPPAPKQLQPSP
ncbi:MAG: SDR family oxidoreductase [Elusimicrobia bacterium]|nr:SDR family oxidoreductase [Elusimicrobiota bacterium]